MDQVNIHNAKTHFSKLVARVEKGEEIVIARDGKPVARLVPERPKPVERRPGTAKGLMWIGEDFDDPLPDDMLDAIEGLDEEELDPPGPRCES